MLTCSKKGNSTSKKRKNFYRWISEWKNKTSGSAKWSKHFYKCTAVLCECLKWLARCQSAVCARQPTRKGWRAHYWYYLNRLSVHVAWTHSCFQLKTSEWAERELWFLVWSSSKWTPFQQVWDKICCFINPKVEKDNSITQDFYF